MGKPPKLSVEAFPAYDLAITRRREPESHLFAPKAYTFELCFFMTTCTTKCITKNFEVFVCTSYKFYFARKTFLGHSYSCGEGYVFIKLRMLVPRGDIRFMRASPIHRRSNKKHVTGRGVRSRKSVGTSAAQAIRDFLNLACLYMPVHCSDSFGGHLQHVTLPALTASSLTTFFQGTAVVAPSPLVVTACVLSRFSPWRW